MLEHSDQLLSRIDSLNEQAFQTIQSLRGEFQFPGFDFQFIRIQGSPGANPASIASVKVDSAKSNLPKHYLDTSHSRLAVADFLIRRFNQAIVRYAQQNRGRDGSGSFHTITYSQKMLQRDSVLFLEQKIEIRFIFSLPATGPGGGRFDSKQTRLMFEQELTAMVDYTLGYKCYDTAAKNLLKQFVDIQNHRKIIENYMATHGICVFINNGAVLPRQSGVDDKPAQGEQIIDFQSPDISQVEIALTDSQSIQGMAIKEGVTCITGGGYHGKSTLIQAITTGIYAHIPNDGREYIVTRQDAVFIRAEEGRNIQDVDISSFIGTLPNAQNTQQFSSQNASGSTSQAAAIVESIAAGSRLLLFDEDTCATNFLYRDELINKVLDTSNEPIKALYTSIRSMWCQYGVSMIFVIGGLGSFLQKSDSCILMENYQCKDISSHVRNQLGEIWPDNITLKLDKNRYLSAENFNPEYHNQRLKKTVSKRIKDLRNAPRQLEYGMDLINLEALLQIAESPQVLSIGYGFLAIRQAMQQADKVHTIEYWVNWLYQQVDEYGMDVLQPDYPGTLSLPRKFEVIAAINRVRSLKISKTGLASSP